MTWLHFTDGYFSPSVCVYTAPLPFTRIKNHRKVMENVIGRKLKKEEHIHHINKNHKDNRIENLMIVSAEEHREIHRKYPKVILDLTCAYCKKEFSRETTTQKTDYIKKHNQIRFYCSKECQVAYRMKNKRVITEEERRFITKGKAEELNGRKISKKYKITEWVVYKYLRNL